MSVIGCRRKLGVRSGNSWQSVFAVLEGTAMVKTTHSRLSNMIYQETEEMYGGIE
jgi:hypothetical protein